MLTVGVTTSSSLSSTTNDLQQQQQQQQQQQDEIAKQFKILTCSATSCAKQRTILGMDPFATYGAFYNRIQEGQYPHIALEEVSCLGSCQQAPCVAVEHEDFEGTVALEGMTENEFNERVFHNVITEVDADRIWAAIENAIQVMAEEEVGNNNDNDYDDDWRSV